MFISIILKNLETLKNS